MDSNKIIDGTKVSREIFEEIKNELTVSGIKPGIALIIAGNNPASESYVKMKAKRCAELGYHSIVTRLEETVSEEIILEKINEYNTDDKIHGILVQMPLPKHINELNIIKAVDYKKDVDGFHPENTGRLLSGEKCFIPCTPLGIMELLKRYKIATEGKHTVVLGRSNIVGKPIANLLMQKKTGANSTVTVCHSSTPDIAFYTIQADIIIAAIGKPLFLKGNMIKDGCVIIDVGINRVEDKSSAKGYRIVGDVDYNDCLNKAALITPVPGGVGPMTIAMLLKNTFDSAAGNIY